MSNVRLGMTQNEKLAMSEGSEDSLMFAMNSDNDIDNVIKREKAYKFNEEYNKAQEEMEKRNEEFKEAQESLEYNPEAAEIRPMFGRLLIKPFGQNPFQKMVVKGKLIVDAGGYTPHTELNPMTGKYEELKEFIITGCIVEVGPDVKYLKEGDVIYYRRDTAVPVPFFKQGLVSIDEHQVIACVNENLTDRFNTIKNGE